MPRRSIWKGSFVDAFLLRMKKKRDILLNRRIWSRRSSILPDFVNSTVRIHNGKTTPSLKCSVSGQILISWLLISAGAGARLFISKEGTLYLYRSISGSGISDCTSEKKTHQWQ
nr:ribosomal protein S19 [Sapria himalayana]